MSQPRVRPAIITATSLVLAAVLAIWSAGPPAALGADAPDEEFSAGRADAWLRILTGRPRPTGSAAQDEVVELLVARLSELGLEVTVQETTAVSPRGPIAARVRNVLGRLPGSNSTRPVLLVAHHDSVPGSPGAGDDGSGVVTLLETARALRASAPLRNDVIFVITDAEELGLLGAVAFVSEHPWSNQPGVVLNFEGRGCCGTVSMFETSSGNGRLIGELAAAAPYPQASSLSYEIYRRLPNDTDLTVFRQAGAPALNFAFIGGYANYHSPVDDIDALDPASVQHLGSYALSLARRFGSIDLTDLSGEDRIYFAVPVYGLIHYSSSWAKPLAVVTLLTLLALTAMSVRLGFVGWRAAAWSMVTAVVAVVAVAAINWAGASAYTRLHPQAAWLPGGHPYSAGWAVIALVALCVGAVATAYAYLPRSVSVVASWLPPLWIWGALLAASAWWMPGASYLLQWPLLLALAALEIRLRERGSPEVVEGAALALALPAVVMLAPLPEMLIEALGLATPVAGLAMVGVLTLLLAPQWRAIASWRRYAVGLAAFGIAVLAVAVTMASWSWTPRHPRQDSLTYGLDADTGEAVWVSFDPAPDDWTRQALGDLPGRADLTGFGISNRAPALTAPATPLALVPPVAEVLEDLEETDSRTLLFRLSSPRGASGIDVRAGSDVQVEFLEVDGKPTPPFPGSRLLLRFDALPATGITLRIRFTGAGPDSLSLVDRSFGLPPGMLAPRPANVVSKRFVPNELTLVRTDVPLPRP